MSGTAPTVLRPGSSAWRIGGRGGGALRCVVGRILPDGMIEVRSSRLSKIAPLKLRAEDVFADKDACRAEIVRRREAPKDRASIELPPGVTRGLPAKE